MFQSALGFKVNKLKDTLLFIKFSNYFHTKNGLAKLNESLPYHTITYIYLNLICSRCGSLNVDEYNFWGTSYAGRDINLWLR